MPKYGCFRALMICPSPAFLTYKNLETLPRLGLNVTCSWSPLPQHYSLQNKILGFNLKIKSTSSLSMCVIYTPLKRYDYSGSIGVNLLNFMEKMTKILWVKYGHFIPIKSVIVNFSCVTAVHINKSCDCP